MGPHEYGRYLHILTPATSEEQAPPWEGITGRVKHLQKQETNKMMTEMKRSNDAMTDLQKQETNKMMAVTKRSNDAMTDLQKQETNKMMAEMKRANDAMNRRIDENMEANRKAVEANKTQLGDVQQQLKRIEEMLTAVLGKKQ